MVPSEFFVHHIFMGYYHETKIGATEGRKIGCRRKEQGRMLGLSLQG